MKDTLKSVPLPPITGRNRLRRLVWSIAWILLYRPTPIAAHCWRAAVLRLFGARIEGKVYPYPSARIWAPWNLDMRAGSCIAGGVECYNVDRISLGECVTVSQKSYLCTASHDFDDPLFPLTGAPIFIGRHAWVAADAFIGPGVEIGEGAVVLARAVVVRDVLPGTVVGGNPAKNLRSRAESAFRTRGE